MAGTTGQLTTFGVVNFEGELYSTSPEDTPLLSMIGGLYGGEGVPSTVIQWQEYDLRAAAQTSALEGAAFPTPEGRTRTTVFNVLQIIHEGVEVSDTKQGASGQVQDVGSAHTGISATGMGNPVTSEIDFQVEQSLKQIARDVEFALIQGSFQEPVDNTTARKTRGLIEAISTNVTNAGGATVSLSASSSSDDILIDAAHGLTDGDRIQFLTLTGGAGLDTDVTYYVVNATTGTFQIATSAGGTPIDFTTDISAATYQEVVEPSADNVLAIMQDVWDQGGIAEQETAVLIANSFVKRKLSEAFLGADVGFRQDSRTVGGVSLATVFTDFGQINVMLNRYCPSNKLLVVSADQLRMKWLNQEHGFLLAEPLARAGISQRVQISGEWGLQYGNEKAHGELTGLATR